MHITSSGSSGLDIGNNKSVQKRLCKNDKLYEGVLIVVIDSSDGLACNKYCYLRSINGISVRQPRPDNA